MVTSVICRPLQDRKFPSVVWCTALWRKTCGTDCRTEAYL